MEFKKEFPLFSSVDSYKTNWNYAYDDKHARTTFEMSSQVKVFKKNIVLFLLYISMFQRKSGCLPKYFRLGLVLNTLSKEKMILEKFVEFIIS